MTEAIRLKIDAKTLTIIQCVDALERSHGFGPKNLGQFVEGVPAEHRLDALSELVRVDFERQWNRGQRPSVVHYLDEYPELRDSGAMLAELLATEFNARRQAGEQPSVDEFRRIYPEFQPPAAADTRRSAMATLPLSGEASPVSAPELERIGKYIVVRQLGAGGFGVVYEAYDEQLERAVAIKIRHGREGQSGLSDDLLHEARSIAQLDHPNIVRLLEAGETPQGLGYVVYEYIDGETLEQKLGRRDYDPSEAVEWVAQVAEALNYAHQHRIVHRDIKPANILLDSARRPKILDFGLARRNDGFFTNESGQIVGTLAYLSPEQASGDSDWVSSQSDLYSLGVVLYELLCNRRPFQASHTGEMLDQVLHRTPAPPRSFDAAIPPALEDACLKALAKKPADRFKTGSDMAQAVRRAMQPAKKPSLVGWGAALAAVTAACVLAASLLWPGRAASEPSLPEFSSFNLLLADTETPVNSHLPLGPGTALKVEANFTAPAYAYLLVYDQEAPARLIWPPESSVATQGPVGQLIYPPLVGESEPLRVPAGEGATLVVVLASHQPLSAGALNELRGTRLELNISPQIASQAQTSYQIAEPTPRLHSGIPTRSGPQNPTAVRIHDSFKDTLRSHADSFFGNLVPHRTIAGAANH